MKKSLQSYLFSIVTGILLLFNFGANANHINGIDLDYSWVSGNTYKITLTVYGNCASGTFGSLATAVPVICIFDSSSYIASVNLAVTGAGVNVSNVCPRDTDSTTCTNTAYAIPGTKKYVYTANYTLPSTAKCWRFVFTGQMGATPAGRVATTNLSGAITVIYLQDTLNNIIGNNSSPDLTVIPTPYYCLNNPDNYNPGAVDPDGDSLSFSLVGALTNGGGGCTTGSSAVGYNAGYSGTNPLNYVAGTFSFNSLTGQIGFTPSLAGTYCVVYNVREYRGGTVVGTSQREMYFLVQTCSVAPPTGVLSGATIGTIVDSVHYQICQNNGVFSVNVNPTEPDTNNTITVTATGVPAWATLTILNNGTNHPTCTFTGNSTTAPPGAYSFTLTYVDNNCPISGSNTIAYYITIASVPATITFAKDSVCVGSTITYSDATAGGTWSSANTTIATVGSGTGLVTGVSTGGTFITYSTASGCSRDTVINVMPLPAAITGTFNVCVGSTTSLADATGGGAWSSGTPAIATINASGVVTGVAFGTSTIVYKLPTSCSVSAIVTVNALPAAITGATALVCVGSNITYADITAGGTWSSSNTSIATITAGGVITGVSAGTAIISYSMGTGCATTKLVTVNPLPANIAGFTSLCVGTTVTLTDLTAGGVWSSSTPATATISVTGVVTGIAAGTTTISYTLPTGCYKTLLVTVVGLPAPITGTLTVCTGFTTSLANATPGGTWTSGNIPIATVVGGTGVVTGVAVGNSVITYTVGSGCYVTAIVTVSASPAPITGSPTICVGSNTTFADVTLGGIWSSVTPAVTTITAGGVATGVSVGTSVISYTLGLCASTVIATVNTAPVAITGVGTVCNGFTTLLSDATIGGAWTSAAPGVATVSGTGLVTGVTVGTAVISYSIGTCTATKIVTVNIQPAAITGVQTICLGSSTNLADATLGGIWSSVTPAVATITAGGVATGVSLGTSLISYTIGTCAATATVTVNSAPAAITGTASVCNGFTTNLADAVPGGTWLSASPGVATVSGTGVVTGVSVGTAVISYSIGTCTSTIIVTVNIQPAAIVGAGAICNLTTANLTDATLGGIWSSVTPAVATISAGGVVTAVSVGTTIISYTIGSCAATATETVVTLPSAGSITGPGTVCVASNISLTDGTPGGVWSSSSIGIATVSGLGVVTGVANGTDSIKYSVTTGCGTAMAFVIITVNPLPNAGIISGANILCEGTNITLTETVAGGTWSALNGNATVVAGGIVTGVTGGTDIITYTVINGCGTATATYPITIDIAPVAGAIAGPAIICAGSFAILTDGAPGGVWSSTNPGVATVSGTGVVTGITGGVATISYSVANPCGIAAATKVVTVTPLPVGAPISGPTSVCVGSTIPLSDIIPGGTWHATNGLATVVAGTGVVTGVTAGLDTIYYSLTNSCGTTNDSTFITINPLPNPGTITGATIVCVGSSIAMIDPAIGGTYSISNGNATIIPATGVVTGVTLGLDTVTYTLSNMCGTATTDRVISVSPVPTVGSITGPGNVCVGSTIVLSNSVPGGTWSATNGDASVSGAGVVTGLLPGTDTILYTLVTVCGSIGNSAIVVVNPLPVAGSVSGPAVVCVGSLITMTETTGGGIWSMSNANATISITGDVVGVAAGLDTVLYSVTNMCGTASTSLPIAVNAFPSAGVISGPSSVCIAGNITLTETVPGGVWSSSSAITTVSAGGVVTGVTAGTDTISYTVTNSCGTVGTFQLVSVIAAPDPGTITGPSSVCLGANITLVDPVVGGVWSSVYPAIASVAGGVVTGLSAGIDTIKYSLTNVCGVFSATSAISVVTFPSAGTISGPSSVCVGSAITLLESIPGGIWIASNGNATLLAPGILSGVTVGIDTIFYSVTNACGTAMVSTIIPVNPLPVVAAISGLTDICVGTITTMTDATAGGNWISSNPAVATIDMVSGLTTGVTSGTAVITYTVTNAFGCPASVTMVETVHIPPVTPAISGIMSECVGATTTLNDALAGGTWSSSNITVATIDAVSGIVTGVSAGVTTITYTVINICGTSFVTALNTVNALPVVAAITGTLNGCIGVNNTLADVTAGGVWSSSNTAVATIDAATGVVTGVAAGSTTINYTVTNAFGCSSSVSAIYIVNPTPVVAAIVGITHQCIDGLQPFTDATVGGIWSSSNATVASVNVSGVVTGLSGGIVTISYTVISALGCAGSASVQDTVFTSPAPSPISGTTTVCVGNNTTLADAMLYGTWMSSNNAIATIGSSTGIVTGVSAGTVQILYNVTNSCGSAIDTANITVNPLPLVAPVSGSSLTICAGASTVVTDATSGGVWSSSNTSLATVGSTTGIVSGIAAGTVTISYTVTNGFGCANSATFDINFGSSIGSSYVSPSSATICNGHSVYMHVITSGSGLSYQWYLNGVIIVGATNYNYTANLVGNYSVVVGNGTCQETLTGTHVTILTTPVIGYSSPNILYTGSYTSYQWLLNGMPIPGATGSLYNESAPGTYLVVVTDANGCTDTSGSYVISGGGTGSGVKNVNYGSEIHLYPNPATSVIHIDAPILINVKVLSPDGKVVIEQKEATNINVSSLANGMYIVMVYNQDGFLLKTDKFMKLD